MCKAISDIGMAITKAKMQVFQSAEELQKAKLKKEKISKKLKEHKKEEKVVERVIEKVKTVKKREKVESIVMPQDYQVSSQQVKDEVAEPFEESIKTQKGIIKMVESDSRSVAEINELMEVINAKEFGPGESPLRELAKIGYMLRNGVTTEQIDSLYDSQYFPALRVPQSQSALVQLVERQGYGALITEVLTEETAQDEEIIAAKAGFRAFLKMVELKHNSVEEVIAHFYPEDFKPRAWEQKEAQEVSLEFIDPNIVKN